MKNIITAKGAPAALGPYSHATEWNGLLFTSGQIGIDPATGKLCDTLEEQILQIFKNLEDVLRAAGSGLRHVLKCTVFVTDLDNFAIVNKLYGEAFGSDFPARSCVQVTRLPAGAAVEIEAIAIKS